MMEKEQIEEITEYPEQSTFNTDDMSVIEEGDEENEDKNE